MIDSGWSNSILPRLPTAFALIVLGVAIALWSYVIFLNGMNAGFNEALEQPGGRFPVIEIAIGMGSSLYGIFCARRSPFVSLGVGAASILFSGLMVLGQIA